LEVSLEHTNVNGYNIANTCNSVAFENVRKINEIKLTSSSSGSPETEAGGGSYIKCPTITILSITTARGAELIKRRGAIAGLTREEEGNRASQRRQDEGTLFSFSIASQNKTGNFRKKKNEIEQRMVTTSPKAYLPHSGGGTELIGNVCGFPVKRRLAGDRPCKAPTCLSRLQMASGVGALRNGGEGSDPGGRMYGQPPQSIKEWSYLKPTVEWADLGEVERGKDGMVGDGGPWGG